MSLKKILQDQRENTHHSTSKARDSTALPQLTAPQAGVLDLQHKAGNRAANALLRPSQENDPLEREAKSMADRAAGGQTVKSPDLPARTSPTQSSLFSEPGQALAGGVRQNLEQRFGRDLSRVRLQRGPQAAQAADALDARAFTHGQEIAFGSGEYAPHTSAGEQLLSHEVAHTLQPQPAGVALRQPKPAPKPSVTPKTDLEKAEESIKDGLLKLDTGKPADLKAAPAKLRAGIKLLKKAAGKESGDRKAKMERIAAALEVAAAYAAAATAKSGGLTSVQKAFKDKSKDVLGGEEIAKGKYEQAANLYKGLPQDFTDIFPKLGMDDPGFNLMFVASATEQRLRYMESMSKAGAAPKKYPPGPDEVEAYFASLGGSGARDAEIVTAYEDYAGAFFEHAGREMAAADMSTKPVYAGKLTYNLNLMTDCDGFVRLGARLFGKAGYKLDDVMVGVKDVSKEGSTRVEYTDAHAIALISKGSDSHYISNQNIHGSESSAFNVAWKYPDAPLVIGHGKNLAEAEKDAINKLTKKGSK